MGTGSKKASDSSGYVADPGPAGGVQLFAFNRIAVDLSDLSAVEPSQVLCDCGSLCDFWHNSKRLQRFERHLLYTFKKELSPFPSTYSCE